MSDITSNLVVHYPFNSDILDYATGTGVSNATNTGGTISNSIYQIGSGSLYLNNPTTPAQYLTLNSTVANASGFPGTNGFTISMWIKASNTNTPITLLRIGPSGTNSDSIMIRIINVGSGKYISFELGTITGYGQNSFAQPGSNAIVDGNWNHIVWTVPYAAVGQGTSNWGMYVNGSSIYTVNNYYPISTVSRNASYIGYSGGLGGIGTVNESFNGYIDDVRIYKRVLTQADITNLYNLRIPNYSNTAIVPMYFDGTISSYLNLGNDSSIYFGTGTYTIEWWQYLTFLNPYPRIFSIGTYPNATIAVSQQEGGSNNNLYLFYQGSSSYNVGPNSPANKWIHCAITRDSSNSVRIFINGVQKLTPIPNIPNNYTNPGGSVFLGIGQENSPSTVAAFNGWILGFTWTKGECLYTTDFTPPTSLPTVSSNTVVQLYGLGPQVTAKGTYGSTLDMTSASRNFNVITSVPPSPNQYPAGYNNQGPATAVDIPCFREDTRILCIKNGEEQYIPIKELRKGDYVKTVKHGYLPISMIGHRKMKNPGDNLRIKDRLYHLDPSYYPDLFEDLYITGCHSILVDELTIPQRKKITEDMEDVYITDNYYRLMAYIDEHAIPYQKEGDFTIYHFSLENEDYYGNYGVYANGLLVESTSNRYMKELSNMELIQ